MWKQTIVEDLIKILYDVVGRGVVALMQLTAVVEASGYEKCGEPCSLCAFDISINLIADHQKTVGTCSSDAFFENCSSWLTHNLY